MMGPSVELGLTMAQTMVKHTQYAMQNRDWPKGRFYGPLLLYGGLVVFLFPITRILHLPTCNIMNVALVQMA